MCPDRHPRQDQLTHFCGGEERKPPSPRFRFFDALPYLDTELIPRGAKKPASSPGILLGEPLHSVPPHRTPLLARAEFAVDYDFVARNLEASRGRAREKKKQL